MEFHEKLQELRKQRGLTQEELASALYVSRTAISKWESGRGYPNLDSLKTLAQFYSVTVDELLSGDELLSLAREDNRQTRLRLCDLVFGLLDCSISLLFFLPLFGQQTQNMLQECSLLTLTAISPYLKTIYFVYAIATVIVGLLLLSLQTFRQPFWATCKHRLSVILSVIGTLLFIVSTQPYVAALLFFFLLIKIFMLIKRR